MADETLETGTVAVGDVPASLRFLSRRSLALQHLWSALHNARLCRDLEAQLVGNVPFHIQHRASAINAVLSAVAFVEALVNEVFQDATDAPDRLDSMTARLRPLTKRCRDLMREFWERSELTHRSR